MNKILSITILLFFLSIILVQGQTLTAYEDAAQEAYEREEYSSALKYYETALEIDPNKIENLYMVAETARLIRAHELAEKYYLEVAAHEEWTKYPHADFLLASVKKSLGKYEAAADLFQRFVDNSSSDVVEKKFIEEARQEVINCQKAPQLVEDSLDYITITNCTNLNTPSSEFAPIAREGELFYSSLRFKEEVDAYEPSKAIVNIYKAYGENAGELLRFETNNKPTTNPAFSPDRKVMYYTICEYIKQGEYSCDIFSRKILEDNKWGEAVKLPNNINQLGYSTSQPNIGLDASGNEWLFFSSDRPNGEGGMDIWCSLVKGDGSYSSPFNIKEVNTAHDEISPFFQSKTQTLFFSSKGHTVNIGGYDIFKTTKTENDWSKPINVGVPLNSSYNDTYYSVNENGRIAYFASNRPGAIYLENQPEYATCCPDIYRADIDLVVDLITSTFNGLSQLELLETNVQLVNISTGAIIQPSKSTEANKDFFELDLDSDYMLIASRNQYTSDTVRFDTRGITGSTTIERDLFLVPPIELTALTYDRATEQPLNGVTVELIELPMDNELASKENLEGNDFDYNITFEKTYKLVATKTGYNSAEVIFTTMELEKIPTQITKQLYLVPTRVAPVDLPVVLYFDNDRPGRRTLSRTTNKTYEETFDAYYAKKQEFITEYTRAVGGDGKSGASERMEDFFENEVLKGFEQLEIVSESLLDYLQNGNSMEISIRGYASPRAAQVYNENLTQRRIESLKNHFKKYRDGLFKTFLDNKQLVIVEEPFGENSAPTGIASEFEDPDSIYSIQASRERRVEIIEVRGGGLSYESTSIKTQKQK